MQVARPDQLVAIEQIDLLPARLAQQSIVQGGIRISSEDFTHEVPALTQAGERTLPRRSKGATSAQGLAHPGAVESLGDNAGQPATGAEHRRGRHAATAAALVFIAVRRGSHPIAALQRFGVDPMELAPGRTDLDQPLELRVMPVEAATTSADVGHHQMPFGVLGIGGVQLVHRPGPRLDGAGGELVPLEGAHQPPLVVEGELGLAVMQEHHVAVAARTRVATPLGAGITNKSPRFVEFVDQLDRLVPALLGDIEVVGGVAEYIEPGDIATVAEVVQGVVGAHRVIGVHMQVGVERTQRSTGRVDGNKGLGAVDKRLCHLGGQTPLAHGAEIRPSSRAAAQPSAASVNGCWRSPPSGSTRVRTPLSGKFRQVLPQASSTRNRTSNASPALTSRGTINCTLRAGPGTMSSKGSPGTSANFELPNGSMNRRKRKSFSTKLCTRVPAPPWRRSPRRMMTLSPGFR